MRQFDLLLSRIKRAQRQINVNWVVLDMKVSRWRGSLFSCAFQISALPTHISSIDGGQRRGVAFERDRFETSM